MCYVLVMQLRNSSSRATENNLDISEQDGDILDMAEQDAAATKIQNCFKRRLAV